MLPSVPSPTIDYPVFEFPWDIPPDDYDEPDYYEIIDDLVEDDGETQWTPDEEEVEDEPLTS